MRLLAVEAYLPTLTVVTLTALVDSINPCAIGVLILMMSVLISQRNSFRKILVYGSIYITSVYVVYFLAGLGLMYIFSHIPLFLTEYLSIGVGAIVVAGGLVELKDFFWYGEGFSLHIPTSFAKRIHDMSSKTTIVGIVGLGAFVSAVELPCTGGPYLAIITFLSRNFNFNAFLLLLYYNVIFVGPLIVIVTLIATGKKLYDIKKWKQDNKGYMRLFTGLLLVGMGWLLILIANGIINFG